MQIRTRLTLRFVIIVAFIQLLASLAIYFNSADYRQSSFYERLKASAVNKTVLLMELEGIGPERLEELTELGAASLNLEKFYVYNFRNELLYNSDKDSSVTITTEMLDVVRLDGEARFTIGEYELAGILFADRYNRLVVVSAAIDDVGFEQLQNLRRVLLFVLLFSLLLLSIFAWIYAGQALKPISRIIEEVDQISFINLSERLKAASGKDELGRLEATFNRMLDRIEASLNMQRNFVANASHELRTPLTSIMGQLEVVLMKARSEAEYREKISSVLDDIRKLTTIANRLLLLAQASSEYSEKHFRPLALDVVLWECQSEIQGRNPHAIIHITLDDEVMEAENLTLNSNEQLLKTAILNLMENAIKFSQKQEVFVHLSTNEKQLIVKVRDQGIGIPESEITQIFQPFYRSSNAQEIQGHGIGLSLVQKIMALHRAEIKVKSKVGIGTEFSLIFPR